MDQFNEIKDLGWKICTQEYKFGEIGLHDTIVYRGNYLGRDYMISYSCHIGKTKKNKEVKHDKGAYFKVLNAHRYQDATKMVRISLTSDEIIHDNYRRWEELKLTDGFIDEIINTLSNISEYTDNISVFEYMVNRYNDEAEYENLKLQNISKEMPDYSKLSNSIKSK